MKTKLKSTSDADTSPFLPPSPVIPSSPIIRFGDARATNTSLIGLYARRETAFETLGSQKLRTRFALPETDLYPNCDRFCMTILRILLAP